MSSQVWRIIGFGSVQNEGIHRMWNDASISDRASRAAQVASPKPESAISTDKDLTCEVVGHSLLLGPNDFKALRTVQVAPADFKALGPNSKKRAQICTTRYVARLIVAKKATCNDIKAELLVPLILLDDEANTLNDLQADCFAALMFKNKEKLFREGEENGPDIGGNGAGGMPAGAVPDRIANHLPNDDAPLLIALVRSG